MDRTEVLRSVGFTEEFIKALHEFEKSVPEINYENPFNESDQEINSNDTTGSFIISKTNDNYNHNLIVKQSI